MVECFQRDFNQESPGQETDTWAHAYPEIDGPCDVTDMVFKALQASGFT